MQILGVLGFRQSTLCFPLARSLTRSAWSKQPWIQSKAFRSLILHIALVLNMSLVLPAEAKAEIDPFSWFEHLFQGQAPQAQQGLGNRPLHKLKTVKPKPTRSKPNHLVAEKPKVAPGAYVAVFGDGLAQMLTQGLTEALDDRPDLAVLHKTQDNSGLVRLDTADWAKKIHDYLESGPKIDLAVILIGSNDRQPISVKGKNYELLSPEWREIYAERIEAVARQFAGKNIPLVWVGLPIMKDDAMAMDVSVFNDIYHEYSSKFAAKYIDVWEDFADEHGAYNAFGPDINGQTIRLRSNDGVYFTHAGARKLAHFVELEVYRQLDKKSPEDGIPQIVNLPPDENATVDPQAKAAPIKPDIGPVWLLSDLILAPDGKLVEAVSNHAKSGGEKLEGRAAPVESKLQNGMMLEPKKGRADDFTWP
jgi:hypothetical protein